MNSDPVDGVDNDTVGGEFAGSLIVIETCFESVNPPLSVTCAVMVCVPTERFDFVNDVPVPIAPLILDVHWIDELSEPCSGSDAVAENDTESPCVNSDPVDGDDNDTVGG